MSPPARLPAPAESPSDSPSDSRSTPTSTSSTGAASRAAVTVSPRAAERIRAGHPWVGGADVMDLPPPGKGVPRVVGAGEDIVRVVDRRGALLGTAFYNPGSPLPLRMLDRAEINFDAALIGDRLVAAAGRRRSLYQPLGYDAFRLVHGEADLLPGLFVDSYGGVAVLQSACAAMDAREPLIAELLHERLGYRMVVARDDGGARDFEALPRRRGVLLGGGPTTIEFHDAGSKVRADVLVDGKTGGFLDQQENHARAGQYARSLVDSREPGRVGPLLALDTFSYHGGFALALARAGLQVSACDENAAAVARLRENAAANAVEIDARCDNAFDVLRRADGDGALYDMVVVDPPALAKRKSALPAAERAYKELNLRALRVLRPGGILITCSCSGKLTPDRFAAVVEAAAHDVGRPVQLLERRGAGRDHPPLVGAPETEYLKCWALRVLA